MAPTSKTEFTQLTLKSREQLSHDTQRLVFAFPNENDLSGMVCASLYQIQSTEKDEKDENYARPYTPTSTIGQKGFLEFVIKKYPGGKLGTFLHELPVGQTAGFKGPFTKTVVPENEYKHIGMIAGGTGITPMYQVAKWLLDLPHKVKIVLLYSIKTPNDYLLKEELEELAKDDRFVLIVKYSEKAPEGQSKGHLGAEEFKANLPPPGEGKVYVCGPPGMMVAFSGNKDFSVYPPGQGEVTGLLKDLGYSSDTVFKF